MSVIDDVKDRLNIVEIIGEQVQLRKTGKTYLGFCPFHSNTRTPAFTVYPDTQTFYCFGCHASGSVFDFVMRQQGLDFRETLQQLAQRAGVSIQERTSADQQQDHKRTRLLEITAITARYFNYILLQHKRGSAGREYIEQRAVTQETIEAFQLGYSLNEWDHLLNYLTQRKGYSHEEVHEAGLIVARDQGGWYDRFRGRLIFPIRNVKGEVIGFGGRAIGDTQPKYINTPQTLLFDKSRMLYGIDLARDSIRSHDACVLVEGYVDVLTAHQHGFRNVVAPLGTALTEGHIRLLKKLSHNIYMALDSDTAGLKATLRGVSALQNAQPDEDDDYVHPVITAQGLVRWESDIHLRIIAMPAGKDPDDVIKHDPQQWRSLIEQARPVVDFYIEAYTAGLNLQDPQDQRTALDRIIPVIAQLEGTQQRVYIAQLERLVGMRAELILDMVRGAPATSRQAQQARQRPPAAEAPPQKKRSNRTPDPHLVARDYRVPLPTSHEDYLIALILRYPSTHIVAEEIIGNHLEEFPRVAELLGTKIERLLEQTENRMLWDIWLHAHSPMLTPIESESDINTLDIPWAHGIDESLYTHLVFLAQLKLPRHAEYKYRQDVESSTHHLRIKQIRRWMIRLSQQIHDEEHAEEMQQLVTLMSDLNRYQAIFSAPPRSKGFLDMRHTIEKES